MTVLLRLSAVMLFLLASCTQKSPSNSLDAANQIKYAEGFSLSNHDGFSILKVQDPWPNAAKSFTYILKQKGATIPDSLSSFDIINVPIQSIIVTSTTHIPSLEILEKENTLLGFPSLKYITSEKVRSLIDQNKIREIGNVQSLNTEVILDLNPDVVVGFGIDNNNPALENIKNGGVQVVINGDWNEKNLLGKAEWIKFFGALYGLDDKANAEFSKVEQHYLASLKLLEKIDAKPTVMSGALYENQWYLPHGDSWGAKLISEAGGIYLWKDEKGTGSLSLPFETVLDIAVDADIWIGPAQFGSLKQMTDTHPHYNQFKSFKNGQVYSYSTKRGSGGGVIYYELAPSRPDIVLRDLIKIFHPQLLPEHQLYFFEQLK